ncbi:hypothetical protein LTR66_016255, partial [Elasticomyces elasticus]
MSSLGLSPLGSSPLKLDAQSKVKALLADLSESSDGDVAAPRRRQTVRSNTSDSIVQVASSQGSPVAIPAAQDHDSKGSEEEEDSIVPAGGRLAARLSHNTLKSQTESGHATSTKGSQSPIPFEDEPSFKPTRKFLLTKKRKIASPTPSPAPSSRSKANLDQQSPLSNRSARSPLMRLELSPRKDAETTSKSRFTSLVEKHRAARLAREEAENAKKTARAAQQVPAAADDSDSDATSRPMKRGKDKRITKKAKRARGSSPAHASSEDSDIDEAKAGEALTQAARPTRKASRKALEEMNRETQRMARNMQLAHQLVVKRKFSKADFFKSFGMQVEQEENEIVQEPADSSSIPASDEEAQRKKVASTPPSSPLIASHDPEKQDAATEQPSHQPSHQPSAIAVDEDDDFSLPMIVKRHDSTDPSLLPSSKDKGKGKAIATPSIIISTAPALLSSRSSSLLNLRPRDNDSDSDLDIISTNSHKRKYAAFENLSHKRIASKPSHIALRSLAGINAPAKHDSKSRNVSAQQMASNLLLEAGRQAQVERAEKIEKLKAKGIVIKTEEEKEKEEEEVEDLVERFRSEDDEIRRKEKEEAKREGKGGAASDDDDDEDFAQDDDEDVDSGSFEEGEDGEDEEAEVENALVDDAAQESEAEAEDEAEAGDVSNHEEHEPEESTDNATTPLPPRPARRVRIVVDDEEEDEDRAATGLLQAVSSPALP